MTWQHVKNGSGENFNVAFFFFLETASSTAKRGLMLVAKIMQNLANNVEFNGRKERYMLALNTFILDNRDSCLTFFSVLAVLLLSVSFSEGC